MQDNSSSQNTDNMSSPVGNLSTDIIDKSLENSIAFFKPQGHVFEISNNPFMHLATLGMHETTHVEFHDDDIIHGEPELDDEIEGDVETLGNSVTKNNDDQVGGDGNIEERVQKAFELSSDEKLVEEYACYLVRSILLKGYAYVTENHLCFYAALPPASAAVIKRGFLKQRTYTGPKNLYVTHWFSLTSNALVSYANSSVNVC